MADVAHDASGPATSPKPGDIASQQASRLDSPDRGKLRVFISYSRDDLHFADQLDAALNACGFECIKRPDDQQEAPRCQRGRNVGSMATA